MDEGQQVSQDIWSTRQRQRIVEMILDNMQDIVKETDLTGNYRYVSPSCQTQLGYDPEELIGKLGFDFVHPEDSETVRCAFFEAVTKGESKSIEYRYRHAKGHYIWVETTGKPLYDQDHQMIGVVFSSRDITKRKQIQLDKDGIVKLSMDILGKASLDGRFQEVSPACERILGWTGNDLVGRLFLQYVHPNDHKNTIETLNLLAAGQPVSLFRNRFRCKDGAWKWLSWNSFPSLEERASYFVARDITATVEAEREGQARVDKVLQDQERHLSLCQAAAGIGSYVADLASDVFFGTPVLYDILGIEPKEEHPIRTWSSLIHPEHQHLVLMRYHQTLKTKRKFNQEYLIIRPADGKVRWVHDVGNVECDNHGNVSRLIGTVMDVTERKKSIQQLRESERQLRLLTEYMLDMVAQADAEGNFQYVSPSYEVVLGYKPEELLGTSVFAKVHPEDRDRVKRQAETEAVKKTAGRAEFRYRHANGHYVWLETITNVIMDGNGRIEGVVITSREIGDRKRADEDNRHLMKLYRQAIEGAIRAMGRVVDKRDPYTAGHQQRVTKLAVAIANELGLSGDRLEGLQFAAQIHDIGKVSVPSEILTKPGKISDLEFGIIQSHARVGFEILQDLEFPWPLAKIVAQHHEKMDGSGYEGVSGEDILLEARILCVADVVEAMASHRPYRPALGIDIALEEIRRQRGKLFDENVVDACVKLFEHDRYLLGQ